VKRSVVFVLFVVVAITALLFSGKFMSHPRGTASANVSGTPAPQHVNGPARGSTAPDFQLAVLQGKGKTLQLSSLKGKAVLVNFWATYCDPCKVEMPWLADLQKKYGPQGFQILGVVMDDPGEKTIVDFANKMGVNYPVLVGTEKVADLYGGIDGLPMSFFLDRDGKVTDRVLGLEDESLIEASIKKSLGDSSSTASAK
jgi:cytochrome c biogenesis protein CcmG/thiol:disulfide interchange protein DsbE